ncbi:MAG: secondary thiamine-phosphate synthase enzyme YjbQ [Chloroflexota bacterium]|nr:secondary thiamine-phosphate synthase enzyme YjbQ [Dehalococcoidia bacterium]MDW8254794.1 secondary thiamine-phosphate synthase enzyme YjbQ [Chloroflexota bacterium]
MIVSRTFEVFTKGNDDVIDLTPALRNAIRESELTRGTATLFVTGSTAGLTTIEFEPGLVADLAAAFEAIAPRSRVYAHNERWHDDNGHAHIRAALLGPSLVIPFADRVPLLGTWQQVVLVDFDTRPRRREIVCQLMGE